MFSLLFRMHEQPERKPVFMKKLLLIINPNAGIKLGRRYLPEMISEFSRADYLVSVYVTEQRGDAVVFAREHGSEFDLVTACGGDGSLNEVITGLIQGGHSPLMGYIPCGSTNDFAAGLNIPSDPLQACRAITEGSPRTLDVGCFGGDRYFSYTASFGAFTAVSYSTPQNVKNVLGHAAYILEGIRSLADIRPIRLRGTADGIPFEGDYIFGTVCNSTSLGGVLKLEDSQVHLNDGLFESLLIPFPSDLIALNQILTALRTRAYEDPHLIFLRASEFIFQALEDLSWTLDGEEAKGKPITVIRNLHSAVSLMVMG